MLKNYKFQGLRGYAALMIIISHFFAMFDYLGALGVEFFICMSGFLTLYNYTDSKKYDGKWILKKILKIYPLYLVVTIITASYFSASMVYGVDSKHNTLAFILNALMLQTYTGQEYLYGAFTQVGWYMPFFMLSMLVTPVCILAWKRMNKSLAFCYLIILLYIGVLLKLSTTVSFERIHWFSYVFPPYRLLEFFGGGALAVICLSPDSNKYPQNKKTLGILFIINTALIVCLVFTAGHFGDIMFLNTLWYVPVWICVYILDKYDSKIIHYIFENRLIVLLGNISMEMFLCHLCIRHYCVSFIDKFSNTTWTMITFGIIFVLSYIIAMCNRKIYGFVLDHFFNK